MPGAVANQHTQHLEAASHNAHNLQAAQYPLAWGLTMRGRIAACCYIPGCSSCHQSQQPAMHCLSIPCNHPAS